MSHTFHPGIKIGPESDWEQKLKESHARYCEVWYRVDWEEKYNDMFAYLKKHNIHTGLHYWAMINGAYMPNLAYPDEKIWKPTYETMCTNIDTAAKHGFTYVNIHIGNYALLALNLDAGTCACAPDTEVDPHHAVQVFTENVQRLHEYAQKRQVLLLVENIPPYNPVVEGQHTEVSLAHALHSRVLEDIAQTYGIHINFDLGHMMAESPTQTVEGLTSYLMERVQALAPHIKLIHANTVIKPFTGTDSHDGITDADFANGVVPSKTQFIELLRICARHTNNMWIVNEPKDHHIENYYALTAILNQV